MCRKRKNIVTSNPLEKMNYTQDLSGLRRVEEYVTKNNVYGHILLALSYEAPRYTNSILSVLSVPLQQHIRSPLDVSLFTQMIIGSLILTDLD